MALKLKDKVTWTKKPGVWSIEEIHEIPGGETKYWLQLGTDFASRGEEWAIASELKLVKS